MSQPDKSNSEPAPKRGGGRPRGGSQKALMEFQSALAQTEALIAFVKLAQLADKMVERGEATSIASGLIELTRTHKQLLDQVREMLEAAHVEPRLSEMEAQLRVMAKVGALL